MPLTRDEEKALDAMVKEYKSEEKAKRILYASKNKGRSFESGSKNTKSAMAERKKERKKGHKHGA